VNPDDAADTPAPEAGRLAGSLLLARPGMPDPNFRRTVVLLSAHSTDGAFGVVVNRPENRILGDLREEFRDSALADLPVFLGGPVGLDQLILAAWKVDAQQGTFRLFFGLEPDRLVLLRQSVPDLVVRAFRGYSGWSGGQLEGELRRRDWIVQPVLPQVFGSAEGEELWRLCVASGGPLLDLASRAPDDPSVN
jgi:putative transcriptional regulator